jgi:hypothetical protein
MLALAGKSQRTAKASNTSDDIGCFLAGRNRVAVMLNAEAEFHVPDNIPLDCLAANQGPV